MRGRNFHTYSFERVLRDIRDARDRGARTIFLVDDNITLNVRRFEQLCHAIIEARLNKLDYFVQAMTSSIASHGRGSSCVTLLGCWLILFGAARFVQYCPR
jgi:hypothetical protein